MSDITRSEAIDVIESIMRKYEEDECVCCDIVFGDEDYEALRLARDSLKADEAYQLEYEQPELCKADNSVLEDINKMLTEINGEIACAEYHEVECNHKTEKQDGRRVIAKIVHKYCDKYMESE